MSRQFECRGEVWDVTPISAGLRASPRKGMGGDLTMQAVDFRRLADPDMEPIKGWTPIDASEEALCKELERLLDDEAER